MGHQSHASFLFPLERQGNHCTGGCVGARDGLDGCGKSRYYPHSITEIPARNMCLYRHTNAQLRIKEKKCSKRMWLCTERFDITRENKGEQLGGFNEREMIEYTPFVGKNHETSEHRNKNERYKSRGMRHTEHN